MIRHHNDKPHYTQINENDKRLIELKALFEISKTLNSTFDIKSILDNMLLVPMGRMMISRGIIMLQENNQYYTIKNIKGLPSELVNRNIIFEDLANTPYLIEELPSNNKWKNFFTKLKISLIIPFVSNGGLKGILGYGKKLSDINYSTEDIEFLSSIANIAAQSIENAYNIQRLRESNINLDKKVQELNTLFEIGNELNKIFDKYEIFKQLSYSIMGQLMISRFQVLYKKGDVFNSIYHSGSSFNNELLEYFHLFIDKNGTLNKPVILDENEYKELFINGVRIVIPLLSKDNNHGYILIGDKFNNKQFTLSEIDFLSTISNMAVISLDNSLMVQDMIEKRRLEEELTLARNIQNRLLPQTMPQIDGYEIDAVNIASKMVGGDYYDIIKISEQEFIFAIADVSGKGMPASLLMSNLQAALQILAYENKPLDELTAKLNLLIYNNTSIDKFITFFILKLNIANGKFTYVNAGHNPPYLYRQHDFIPLEEGGLILGMMPDYKYICGQGILNCGDSIFMFTDGVTECMDDNDVEFEEKGLLDFLRNNIDNYNPKDLNQKLIKVLYKFAGDPAKNDDITILTIKAIN